MNDSAMADPISVTDQYETLCLQVVEGIATVTMNRPQALNALNAQLKTELAAVFFDCLEPDPEVAVVILTGAGRGFCAGADIKERSDQRLDPADFYASQRRTQQLFRRIEQFPKPVIAAINGVALGGGAELSLVCDIRIAAVTARFGLPEAKLGMIPLAGGTQRLPRLIGAAAAKELIFTGELIDAAGAERLGLVNRIVDDAKLIEEAQATAERIAACAPLAIAFAKRAINSGLQTDVDSAIEFELYAGTLLDGTSDRREGMQSFVEKRRPQFRGR